MVSFSIKDENAFFSVGMHRYLEQVLSNDALKETLYRKDNTIHQADILFRAVEPSIDCLLASSCIGKRRCGIVFFIMNRQEKLSLPSRCLKYFPIIYRDDSLGTVQEKVLRQLNLWQRVGYDSLAASACSACGRAKLTENEIKVLSLLAKELSLTEAAWVLGKNIKTVFTQKKSAMNKLRLKNSYELNLFIINHQQALSVL